MVRDAEQAFAPVTSDQGHRLFYGLWSVYHALMRESEEGVPARREAYLDAAQQLRALLDEYGIGDTTMSTAPPVTVRDGVTDRAERIEESLRTAEEVVTTSAQADRNRVADEGYGSHLPAGSPSGQIISAVIEVLDWLIENSELEPTEKSWAERARKILAG